MYVVYEIENKNQEIDNSVVAYNLNRLLNQIYRLLPLREEDEDWQKPLGTLLIELIGLCSLFPDLREGLKVISKLQGISALGNDLSFYEYRRTIFECCSLMSNIIKEIES